MMCGIILIQPNVCVSINLDHVEQKRKLAARSLRSEKSAGRRFAMAKEKKKKSREEKLAQQRLHKKEKYQEIKNDPEKYAIQKEKERLRYLKRKEQKKLKSIKDLTPRQQRQQRKKWKENRQRYVEKKKQARAVQQMLVDNSPPTSDEEDTRSVRNEPLRDSEVDPLEGPSSSFIEEKIPKNGEQKMIDK
ncbi:protein PXR1-like [Vanessa cardui]|uniref:protein PXR1-like n=1 Tax=Vanessa cardui TaxID=171605 RepID=UPI001F1323C7|nr:protein PXR1-like [Vanessa cardui]